MTTPPVFTRGKGIGKVGRKSEGNTARRLNGRETPASGSTRAKGDIVLPRFLVEAKSTIADSMTIPLTWLAKIAHEARMTGRKSALTVTFVHGDGTPKVDGAWVLIRESDWRELVEQAED